jgi:hypothetical protein
MRVTEPAGQDRTQTTGHLALFPSRHSGELKRSPGFEAFDHVIEKLEPIDPVVIVFGPLVDDLVQTVRNQTALGTGEFTFAIGMI